MSATGTTLFPLPGNLPRFGSGPGMGSGVDKRGMVGELASEPAAPCAGGGNVFAVIPIGVLQAWHDVVALRDPQVGEAMSDALDAARPMGLHRVCSHCKTYMGEKPGECAKVAGAVTHSICPACEVRLMTELAEISTNQGGDEQ